MYECRFTLYSFQGAIRDSRSLLTSSADFQLYSAFALASTGTFWVTLLPQVAKRFLCRAFHLRWKRFGGDNEIRTHDPLLARQVLSQLSYTPTISSVSYNSSFAGIVAGSRQIVFSLQISPLSSYHIKVHNVWWHSSVTGIPLWLRNITHSWTFKSRQWWQRKGELWVSRFSRDWLALQVIDILPSGKSP